MMRRARAAATDAMVSAIWIAGAVGLIVTIESYVQAVLFPLLGYG